MEPAGICRTVMPIGFLFYIKWCNNVLLKGFTAVDGPSWHVVPAACDHVVIDDMNIMSRIVTGDGIDITSSQDVEIKNCFIRSTDDSICIKAHADWGYFDGSGCDEGICP